MASNKRFNVIDYLKWRGDLSFEDDPINEIDNIICSRISYFPFSKIVLEERENFGNVLKKLLELKDEDFSMDDKNLCRELINTVRYTQIAISDFEININKKIEEQFAAITIWLPNNEIFISYNGTDASLVGWKEDFNMSFMIHIPSQLSAVKYLDKISKKYSDVKIRMGGHSKGGNIAIYAGIYCSKEIKDRILDIFSADGPGFDKEIVETEEYKQIVGKVNTYIPQSSIIGRLLEHEEEYHVIKSDEKGIMQHDIYSWEVLGTKIMCEDEITKESEIVNEVVRKWLKETTPEQRQNFINILYELIATTNVEKFKELKNNKFKNFTTIINSYKNMNEDDKNEITRMLKLFLVSAKECLKKDKPEKSALFENLELKLKKN